MENYRDFAIKLAYDAGQKMREGFGLGIEKEWKEDQSPVTITDKAINDMVLARIAETYPEHSVLAEEGSNLHEGTSLLWVCDPIDGTVPFSAGLPVSTFSLALVENGQPILGVIYSPFADWLFVAEKGKGASLNGKAITVSQKEDFKGVYLGMETTELGPTMMEFRKMGAKSLRTYCITAVGILVAGGELVAATAYLVKAWDVAALALIVEEAGGKATGLHGEPLTFTDDRKQKCVFTNGLLHEKFLSLLPKFEEKITS